MKRITKVVLNNENYDIYDKAAHDKIDNLEIPEVDLSNYYNKTEIDTKLENVGGECEPQFGLVKKGQTIPNDENKMFFIFEDTHDGATYITITANVDGYREVAVKNMTTGESDGDLITNNGGGTMTLHIYAHKGDTVIFGYWDMDNGLGFAEGQSIQIPVQSELTINDTADGWVITNAEVEMKIMMNCPSNTSFWGGIKNQTTGQMLVECAPYSDGLKTISVKPTDEIRAGSSNDDYDGGLSDTNYVVVPVRTDGKITPVNYISTDNTWTLGEAYDAE